MRIVPVSSFSFPSPSLFLPSFPDASPPLLHNAACLLQLLYSYSSTHPFRALQILTYKSSIYAVHFHSQNSPRKLLLILIIPLTNLAENRFLYLKSFKNEKFKEKINKSHEKTTGFSEKACKIECSYYAIKILHKLISFGKNGCDQSALHLVLSFRRVQIVIVFSCIFLTAFIQ